MDTSKEFLSGSDELALLSTEELLANLSDNAIVNLVNLQNPAEHLKLDKNFDFQEPDEEDSNDLLEITDLSQLGIHPYIIEDAELALQTLNQILCSTDVAIKELEESLEGPICPYQRTLEEYLGKEFKIPSVYDIEVPKNFSLAYAVETIQKYNNEVDKKMMEQFDVMLQEASDTTYVGITSQNLGNAFSELKTNNNGQKEWVLNKQKLAKHLEFGEIVRNLPEEYIEQDPYNVALRLLARYVEISQ
jgi:hypothetical protein